MYFGSLAADVFSCLAFVFSCLAFVFSCLAFVFSCLSYAFSRSDYFPNSNTSSPQRLTHSAYHAASRTVKSNHSPLSKTRPSLTLHVLHTH